MLKTMPIQDADSDNDDEEDFIHSSPKKIVQRKTPPSGKGLKYAAVKRVPKTGSDKLVVKKCQKVGMTPEELEEAASLDRDAEYAPSDSELSDESNPSDDEKTHRAKKPLFDGFKKSGREVQTHSGDDLILSNRC
jgi:hypothetical protein